MLRKVGLAVLVLLSGSGLAFAQATASINGRIVDQGGAVLPGVAVTATNAATGAARDTFTNAEGLYSIPALTAGTYSVRAQIAGFTTFVREGIELLTGSNLTVDAQLGLANLQENLTVTGQAPLVEATQATLSASIRQSEVVQLPMINRSMASLMNLLPGAREVGGAVSAHGNAQTYVSFSGGSGQNYNMLVDGIDNKEDHCGGASIVYSLEGIQEFKTIATGASAEYGKGTTTILLATKSGTNQLRGSAAVYGRNQNLMAIDYFSKPENGGTGKPPFSRVQYGGSIGGPLIKDKAWFFGSIERTQQDFTVVRPDRITNELRYLVPLNIGVVASSTIPQPSRDLMSQFKVNFQPHHDHSLFLRYSSQYGYVDNDFIGLNAAFVDYANGVMDHNQQKLWNLSPGWTWVINPTTVNQFTAQFITWTHDQTYPDCNLPGVNACLIQRLTFPSGYSSGPIHAFPKWYNFEDKYEFRDDFSKQISRHALKFGVDYTRMPVYGGIFGSGSPGSIAFFDDPSVIATNSNGRYPQGFRTPGIVRTITVFSQPIGDYSSDGNWSVGAYAQDDFKISSKLTLNLGLRYDVYEFMNQPNLEKNRMYLALKAIGNPYGALPSTDKNNFAPRAGFAWDISGNGRDVVRGSYGLYYVMQIKNTYYQRNYLEKPTIFFSTATTNSAIGVGPLANFVYGVTPLPATPIDPTFFPANQRTTGYWYDPNVDDAQTHKIHTGYSHVFPHDTVLAVDYTHVLLQKGWRNIDINPLLPDPNNPNGPRVRPLAADFQRVFGDPNLLGIINIGQSVNRGLYDEVALHFERRFTGTASFQTNYTLAWARGMGGALDGALRNASDYPQVASATGGDLYAPWEWGPAAYDERHRVTVAGIFNLPGGFDVAPSVTAATARPYTRINGVNPSGDGNLQLKDASGNPEGIRQARGLALFNANARITKNFKLSATQTIGLFAELYNLTNRANFGNAIGGNAASPTTYGKPNGYIGGIGAVSTIPNSFQSQFGARFSF
jgi:hypothetical protein